MKRNALICIFAVSISALFWEGIIRGIIRDKE
jgi:hypothetical protein